MVLLDIEVWKQLRTVIVALTSIRQAFLEAEPENLMGKKFESKIIRRIEALASSLKEAQLIIQVYNSERRNFDRVNSFLYLKIEDEQFDEIINALENKKVKLDYESLKAIDITVKYFNYIVEYVDKKMNHIKL